MTGMKISYLHYLDSTNQQVIRNEAVDKEFNKINTAVSTYLAGTDFFAVFLGRCKVHFLKVSFQVSKSIVVSNKEQLMYFYGESYYQRLNNGVWSILVFLVSRSNYEMILVPLDMVLWIPRSAFVSPPSPLPSSLSALFLSYVLVDW